MIKEFFTMLFPEVCVACQRGLVQGEKNICTLCRYELPQTDFHIHPNNELFARLSARVWIKYALAYLKFTKKSRVQKLLHALKYEGNQEIGVVLGHWYGQILQEHGYGQAFDLIIPIPLHAHKLKRRGYNQSTCFARGLSENMGIPYREDILIRKKKGKSQTEMRQLDRWFNVEHAFHLEQVEDLDQKKVLLVDDVVTTGATLEAGLQTLSKSTLKELSFATIAFAQ